MKVKPWAMAMMRMKTRMNFVCSLVICALIPEDEVVRVDAEEDEDGVDDHDEGDDWDLEESLEPANFTHLVGFVRYLQLMKSPIDLGVL